MAAIGALLEHEGVRLLTVSGVGGVGKTRLALEAARAAASRFADGVGFVPLAPIRAPETVATAILQALGEREQPHLSPGDSLIAALADRHHLLLLDNFEHLLAAAPLLATLLERCPRLRILVTSRAALRLRGERLYPIAPLPTPDPAHLPALEELAHVPAVELLVQRAQSAAPGFGLDETNAQPMAAICARLDGLPLALELAAARLTVLAPAMLLRRMERRLPLLTGGAHDLPERQRTLRATLAWSYELLAAEAEGALFRRLAVCTGGCSLEAAEAIGGGEQGEAILDWLEALVSKSLLVREDDTDGEARFTMLETLREFALERLEERGERAEARSRHAAYYTALAEAAEPALAGPARGHWLARLTREGANLRAALGWSRESGATAEGLRLAGALWRFWYMSGQLGEGRAWLEGLLESSPSQDAPPVVRARALQGAAALTWAQGAYERASELAERSLALYRETGAAEGIAMTLQVLGQIAGLQGNLGRAAARFEESVAVRRALADFSGLATAINNLGVIVRQQGDFTRAAVLYEECLEIKRSIGDPAGVAAALNNLGDVALELGEYGRAQALLEESLTLRGEPGVTEDVAAAALINLGLLARRTNELDRAQALLEEALSVLRELGARGDMVVPLATLGHIARGRGELTRASARYSEALDLAGATGERVGAAQCLEGLAATAWAAGRGLHAARLYGAAAALREALGAPQLPGDAAEHAASTAAIRAAVGDGAADAAWAAGRALPLDAAIAEAHSMEAELRE